MSMLTREAIRHNLITNVGNILTQRGIKVGEFEAAIGAYAGFMARMKAEESKMPTFDIVLRMAEYLGVNAESLVTGNFDHPTENLDYLRKFARSLYSRTMAGEFKWDALSTEKIDEQMPNADVRQYPFGQVLEDDCGGPKRLSLEPWGYENNTMSAANHGAIRSFSVTRERVSILDSVFSTMIDQYQRLYLVKYGLLRLKEKNGDPEPEFVEWFELQIDRENTQDWDFYLLCDTLGESEPLYTEFDKLYQELKYHEHDLRISDRARNTIEEFFKSDPDELPF